MFDLRWLRSLARLVSDWLWKNNTALSTALATLRPVARWFCEVLMLLLIPCRESRFWRVDKPRTMLLDMEYHPFWVTDKRAASRPCDFLATRMPLMGPTRHTPKVRKSAVFTAKIIDQRMRALGTRQELPGDCCRVGNFFSDDPATIARSGGAVDLRSARRSDVADGRIELLDHVFGRHAVDHEAGVRFARLKEHTPGVRIEVEREADSRGRPRC